MAESQKDRQDFSDNLNKITGKIHHYRIENLAEVLLPIFIKAGLNQKDTRDAIEQAIANYRP